MPWENIILIFDPKYRVADNLGTALGEMHKYRDGIIHSKIGERAVQNVYIVTPTNSKAAQKIKYFDKAYHEKYGMGALQLIPGNGLNELKEKLEECVREFL
ncbi:hypothetical protein MUB24_21470 [Lederbergia sp. NSJ-179]|uniref:nuclease domain-containing protein n=1 Tax=Lederbergia sp. NSJ-179 TaxID=2931402 RepID=UPI001FD2C409|nr:nuclease domain-containing protein [Lederbergia sp. NSJ-179]MCJ7843396.1 hypothetical protein [Lederbergia sp. NSJ-179]